MANKDRKEEEEEENIKVEMAGRSDSICERNLD